MTQQAPVQKTPFTLFSRITEWSGWEDLYEQRRKVSAYIMLTLCVLLGIGWFISKKQTSSLKSLIQAETLVNAITNPSQNETDETQQAHINTLLSLSKDPEVLSQFSGVLAEENVLARGKNIEERFFTILSQQLIAQGDQELNALAQITLLQEKGLHEDALKKIEAVHSKSTWLTLYLLIQKAYLLRELNQSNIHVIDELNTLVSTMDSASDFFEEWLHSSPEKFFESIKKS